ncbi:MAG: zinc-dependent alcohol dehydrogenase, partial [Candidatus Acidiferrales bacterium]
MKAAILREFKEPLTIDEVAQPIPGADEVLIAVEACGVCHSDLHLADGDWPQLVPITKRPLILGHEIAGRVVEKGASVESLNLGDRVGVPWLHWSCGECDFCRDGNENLCVKQKITGVTVDGGYAEFVKAPATHAIKIPDALSSADAAPLFCAGVTVYRALQHASIQAGQRLAVFGVGGLGHLAVQIAKEMGAIITAVDVSDEKLAQAASLGASETLNAGNVNVVKELRRAGGVHAALVTSASRAAYDTAFKSVRPTGMLLVVGLPSEPICFAPISMAASEIRIRASSVGTREDLRHVLAMAANGKLQCQVASRPLAQVNEVLAELRKGTVSGRIVLTP